MTTTNQDRLCADRKEREMNDNHIADEPVCYCDKNPHDEDCPVTEYARAMFKASGECARAEAAPIASRAEYDPATQPGDPAFDGAEAYQAHLEAMYPDAPKRADEDIRRAALEEAYDAAMFCDGALNNAGAVALKIRALIAAAPHASSVADAAGASDEQLDKLFFWMCTNYKTEGLQGFKAKARELFAAGASERADAEKDAALTDEWILELWHSDNGIEPFSMDREIVKFARAILAANGEKP